MVTELDDKLGFCLAPAIDLINPPSPPGSVLEPRARSARFPVYPPSVERPPAVERNAGGQWCADAEYSACMYETYT